MLARLAALLVLAPAAAAQVPVDLVGAEPALDGRLEALADPDGALGPAAAAAAEGWRPVGPVLSADDLAGDAVWLRLVLAAPTEPTEPTAWALETTAERADVYWSDAAGGLRHRVAGTDVARAERAVDQGYPGTVLLALAPGERRALLVRVAHEPYGLEATPTLRPLRLVRADVAAVRGRALALGNGLFFGVLLALALYNLAMLVALRDASFLWYVAYVGSVGLYVLTVYRYGYDAVWPADVGWTPVVQVVAVHGALVAFPLFVRSFLGRERIGAGLDRALVGAAGASVLGLAVLAALGVRAAAAWLAALVLVLIPVSVAAMARAWRRGYRPSALLGASFVVLAGSAAGVAAPQFGAPVWDGALRGVQVGIALEALLLAVALSWRVGRLRRARAEDVEAVRAAEARRDAAEAAARALEDAARLRSNLLGFAAHDLRTPLANVLGLSDLVGAEAVREGVVEAAGHIGGEARRLLRLIDDLLVTAALDGGHVAVASRPTDLGALVEAAARPFGPRASAKGQRLVVNAPRGHVARLDPDRFTEVVDNLVSNAVKYAPRGGQVEVEVRGTEDEVWVCVADSGPGVPEADQARMFEPFARVGTSTTGGEPSTGLGLAIVKQIVELHEGRVEVDSAPGRGTRVTAVVPALPVAAGPQPVASQP